MRIRPRRRHHYVALAPEPKNHCRDKHERAGNTERDRRPEVSQKKRGQEGSEERAEIDDPIESIEHDLGAMLVRLIELIANERGDARLDSTRTERDQPKPEVERGAICEKHRQ